MLFSVLPAFGVPPAEAKAEGFLVTDNWDDWFEFSTLYRLVFVDEHGVRHKIGDLKIGQHEMAKGQRRPDIPMSFETLDQRFFSVGQDDSYYDALNALGHDKRDTILTALRDMAFQPPIFERALAERVTGISLFRSVSRSTVAGQFRRMASGGARLSRFAFAYTTPAKRGSSGVTFTFEVEPESRPPSNIHVLIGRNGVGKTYLLNRMTRAIVEDDAALTEVGSFSSGEQNADGDEFANLVSVTFSAFDPFEPLPSRRDKSTGIQYAYIGLRRSGDTSDTPSMPPKNPGQITREFTDSVILCRQGARLERWRRALEMLETDPLFRDAEVAQIASYGDDELRKQAAALFSKLSSGHKIVLLTTTRLVETVEERTLVLLDEPEAHLHPPLLSAFVRALSDLLMNRNGVAIIATHSPVVLQEVPRRCAWKMRRTGGEMVAERPEIETFGENVGILTREVFGLEVTESGFHRLLRETIDDRGFAEVIEEFGGELGDEARALVRGLVARRDSGNPG
jgi:predicted ATPase